MKKIASYWPEAFLFAVIIFFLRDVLFFGQIFVSPGLGLEDYSLGTVPDAFYLKEALAHPADF